MAFKKYLDSNSINETYIKTIETIIEAIVLDVLNSKQKKSKYDESLIKLFESSLHFQTETNITYQEAINLISTPDEAIYILDMSCMATWSDKKLDVSEKSFLDKLSADLNLDPSITTDSINSIRDFFNSNKEKR